MQNISCKAKSLQLYSLIESETKTTRRISVL
jgi:hypothetical protein